MKSILPAVLGIVAFVMVLTTTLLIGCESTDKPFGEIRNAVIEKKKDKGAKKFERYSVILDKDGEKVELKIDTVNEFTAIKEGTTVNVSYNKKYYITDISFPKLSDDKGVVE